METFCECHGHIFMDGTDYRNAAAAHQNGPDRALIREHLAACRDSGITYFRDGGDAFGVSLAAREMAAEYGIRYVTPAFAIHRKGRYGGIVGFAQSSNPEVAFAIRIANGYSSTYAAEIGNDVMEYYYQVTPQEELITGTASEIAASTTGD